MATISAPRSGRTGWSRGAREEITQRPEILHDEAARAVGRLSVWRLRASKTRGAIFWSRACETRIRMVSRFFSRNRPDDAEENHDGGQRDEGRDVATRHDPIVQLEQIDRRNEEQQRNKKAEEQQRQRSRRIPGARDANTCCPNLDMTPRLLQWECAADRQMFSAASLRHSRTDPSMIGYHICSKPSIYRIETARLICDCINGRVLG